MSTERRGGIQRIGQLVSRALPPRVREGLVGWQAVEMWATVAGVDASRRSAAVSCRDGQLVVEVVNSVWMCQIEASKRGIVRRLNEKLGAPVVKDVVFRINPQLSPGDTGAS